MPFLIQMPKLGHTMTEGTVLKWHKHAGDTVLEGEAVLTVETDKAEIEIESPAAGGLARGVAGRGSGGGGGVSARGEEQAAVASGASSAASATGGLAPSRREKLTRIQMVGARNVTASWKEIPHFVQMVRIDMKRALDARQSINVGSRASDAAGARVSVTDV